MELERFKETLLEFLGDVTMISIVNRALFITGDMNELLYDAPNGYKVLSPFVIVKVTESIREPIEPTLVITPIETEDPKDYVKDKLEPLKVEVYVCQINFKLYTENHVYSISAHWKENTAQYLGCIASTRKFRAGEDWTRGSDLPDGHFCRETWEKIKDRIIKYEMKGLAKYIVNGRYTNGQADN